MEMDGTIKWPSGARQIVSEHSEEAAAASFSPAATIVFCIGLVIVALLVYSLYRRRRK